MELDYLFWFRESPNPITDSWVLSTQNNSWVPGPRLPTYLNYFCFAALNDKGTEHLLVYGSFVGPEPNTKTTWINKYPSNEWEEIPNNITYPIVNSVCERGSIEGMSREVVVVIAYVIETGGFTEAFIYDIRNRFWQVLFFITHLFQKYS